VENEYLKLTTAIENDNLSYAQEKAAEVQAAFRDLEIMAIKNNAIGNARLMMAEADKARVKKIAPTAYNDALQALNDADAYIGQNPYAAETISQKAAHAEFMARRMMTISQNSQKFKAMTPEGAAIYLESLLERLGQTMNTGDLRDKNVDGQFSFLNDSAKRMKQETQSLEKDNQDYQARAATLEEQLGRWKAIHASRNRRSKHSPPNASSMKSSIKSSGFSARRGGGLQAGQSTGHPHAGHSVPVGTGHPDP
jgi:OOP family OmpA-OmpF porin